MADESEAYCRPLPGTQSIDNTIELIKQQHKKGHLSAYSIEAEVNQFGYELLQQEKNNEALKIFELNTLLYPDAFNSFNNYGECLMKLGRTKEALHAYQRSLELNPHNENVRKILEIHGQ